MSATQLDILALEPFYGGVRRVMLETLARHSRHRWTLLKLPPRRIDRRLMTAATWFSEQLDRSAQSRADVLFCSDALNLAEMHRLTPQLASKPAAVYFHDHFLPPAEMASDDPIYLTNLSTAQVGAELWFNSFAHLREFLRKGSALVDRIPELRARNPMADITGRSHIVPPPIDMAPVHNSGQGVKRDPHALFVDTRDADLDLLNAVLATLLRRGQRVQLFTVGPVDRIDPAIPRIALKEEDDVSQIRALHHSAILLSTKTSLATTDHHVLRALHASCLPLVPNVGVYPELIPEFLHTHCLYTPSRDALISRLMDHLAGVPAEFEQSLPTIVRAFDALAAVRTIDDRLANLAASAKPARAQPSRRAVEH